MKHLFLILVAVLLTSYSVQVFAASQPTPTVKPVITHTPEAQFRLRVMNQLKLITISVKTGKLTQKQAVDLRNSLKDAQQQEMGFIKSHADHKLTPDEQRQLKALLDKNSSALGETPASN